MMLFIKKVNFIVYLAVALVLGFGFGCLVRSTGVQDDLLAASVAKASLYNNQKEDPAVSVAEEKLKNDSEFRESTIEVMELLKERMAGLSDLTDRTLKACSEIPDFIELNTTFQSLQAKAYNTNLAIESVTSGIDRILDGESVPEYEVASNNVFIGYQKINKQLEAGKIFVDAAEAYLQNNPESESAPVIAGLVTDWSVYCAEDALMSGDEEGLAFWGNKYNNLSDGVLAAYMTANAESDHVYILEQPAANFDKYNTRDSEQADKLGGMARSADNGHMKLAGEVNKSAAQVNKAAEGAKRSAAQVNKAAEGANRSAAQVNKAAESANRSAAQANKLAESAAKSAAQVNKAAESANRSAAQVNKAAESAARSAAQVNKAAESANRSAAQLDRLAGFTLKSAELMNKMSGVPDKSALRPR